MNFSQPIPLSLYVHYPWCVQKCPYCDFNSHQLNEDQEQRYLNALILQLEKTLPFVWGRPIHSIFFGGGTPSLMSEPGFEALISKLRSLLGFAPEIEITLEANPGTVDYQKFAGFFEAGANRLSVGIQSFDDDKLKSLGRIHSGEEAYVAVEAAKAAGFQNFNLDLMFALPEQTLSQALQDVKTAISLSPPHLSHYQLTVEPNTPFYKNPPVLPNDDDAWEMQMACQELLANAGYQHYEVSAYAQNEQFAQHNVNYWQFGDYIGLGAGAHGKITEPQFGRILRTTMPASPGGYMEMVESDGDGKQQLVSEEEVIFEFMLNSLRLQRGFDLNLFEQRTGLPVQRIQKYLQRLQENEWVTLEQHYLLLTSNGKRYLNEVLQTFLKD